MDKKILFFDYDGTLTNEHTNELLETSCTCLQALKDKGHYLFLNTGRTREILEESAMRLPFDGFVCGCGSSIIYHDALLLDVEMSEIQKQKVISLCTKYHMDMILEGNEEIAYNEDITSEMMKEVIQRYQKQGRNVVAIQESHKTMVKFIAQPTFKGDEASFLKEIQKDFTYIDRGGFGEFILHGYSKATGMQFLLDYLHIDVTDAFAIGDSANDLPMLEYVQHSILLGRDRPQLLDKVEYVSERAENFGLLKALQHYQLL